MFKIAQFPEKLKSFFKSVEKYFMWEHHEYFQTLVLLIAFSHGRKNISNLHRHLKSNTHRTRFNNFLLVGRFDEKALLRQKAIETVRDLDPQEGEEIMLVIDDSKKEKRGKNMDAVGKIFDPAKKAYCQGHLYVTATLYFRGYTIPFGIRLYVKKGDCRSLEVPFKKLTELAVEMIEELEGLQGLKVKVLFDCFYLCKTVVRACKRMKFKFVSVLKSNRKLLRNGRRHSAGKYGKNLFRRKPKKKSKNGKYQYIRAGNFEARGLGTISVIYSQRKKGNKALTIVTDDLKCSAENILSFYEKRWSIEVFFKQAKSNLGLGQYQNGTMRAAVIHLHLVCFAYILLTHLHIKKQSAKRKLIRTDCLSIESLQYDLRNLIWKDTVKLLKKKGPDSIVKELDQLLVMR